MKINIDNSQERTRYVNYDDTWNVEGLRASRKDTDGDVVICPITEKELYFYRENGTKILLETYGVCFNCEGTFHRDAIVFNDGIQHSSYPVVYQGRWCVECNTLSESEWRETKEMLSGVSRSDD